MAEEMRPYQVTCSQRIAPLRSLLVLRYGGGKTWVTCAAMERLYARILPAHFRDHQKAFGLWITKSVLRGTAMDELSKRFTLASPAIYADIGAGSCGAGQVVIMSYREAKTADAKQLLRRFKPLFIVFDESTRMKNAKSVQAREIHKIALEHERVVPNGVRVALTGNPMPENPTELWSQFQFCLASRNPFGRSYYQFLRRWFIRAGFDYRLDIAKRAQFWGLVRAHTAHLTPAEWAEYRSGIGIETLRTVVTYTPSSEQVRLLKQLTEEWELETPDGDFEEYEYTMSIAQRALQITHGFYYTGEGSERAVTRLATNPKLDTTVELLHELMSERGRQVLVWTHYREDRNMLLGVSSLQRYGIAAGPDREVLRAFERGEIRIILMPVSGAEGYNELVKADTAIYFANTWSGEGREQADHRIIRLSQTSPTVTFIDVVGEGLRDQALAAAVAAKSVSLVTAAVNSLLS